MFSRLEVFEQTEKCFLPRIPSKETINNLSARANDLSRYVDDGISIRRKIHPQQPLFFLGMFFTPSPSHGDQECGPCLETPCQRSNDHVSPVAIQIVQRCRQCMDTIFRIAAKFRWICNSTYFWSSLKAMPMNRTSRCGRDVRRSNFRGNLTDILS